MASGQRNSISALLEKMTHYDKDERYMATSDLCELLKRHAPTQTTTSQQHHHQHDSTQLHLDATTEKKICDAILLLLDDKSNDVQTVAVRTLVQLFHSVQQDQIIGIARRLCILILDKDKGALRDVYSDGLRKLVNAVPIEMGNAVFHKLSAGLVVEGIKSNSQFIGIPSPPEDKDRESTAEDIMVSCLEVMTALLNRFGSLSSVSHQHESLLDAFLPQLASPSHLIRKRACNAIASLSTVLSSPLLYRLIESLLHSIDDKKRKGEDARSFLQTMCTVSGTVGHRLGQDQVDRIVPIFLRFVSPTDAVAGNDVDLSDAEDEEMDEGDDAGGDSLANELRESCFTGFRSFVLRCPGLVRPHLGDIVRSALAHMRHDPNYSYDDEYADPEEDGGDGEDEDYDMDSEEEEEEEYDDEEYSDDDDDDDSWKVRRSAIRTLAAVVQMSKNDPSKIWIEEYSWKKDRDVKTTMAGALVERFKEREENCRVDIIKCFESLLGNTLVACGNGEVKDGEQEEAMDVEMSSDDNNDNSRVIVELQTKVTPAVVNACVKQLGAKKGGAPTKAAALALLSVLCGAPGGLGSTKLIESVLTHVQSILGPKAGHGETGHGSSKTLKLDALSLVRSIIGCKYHDVVELKNGIVKSILPDICRCVQEHWYKVIAEALRVLTKIPLLLVASNSSKDEMTTVSTSLYSAIEPRLAAHDLDQEIKECALSAAASLLSTLHHSMDSAQRDRLLFLLLQRLKNDTTSIAAMKAIIVIAKHDGMESVDLSSILTESIGELASMLGKNVRGVKQNAILCLTVLVQSQYGENSGIYDSMLKELSGNIVDNDLHICHLSLKLAVAVLEVCPSSSPSFKENVLPAALSISISPLLQDSALESLLEVLGMAVKCKAIDFQELLQALQSRANGGAKQVISNLAKCISAVTISAPASDRETVISNLIASLESKNTDSDGVQLALRVSGDIGQKVDLSQLDGATDRLQSIYFSYFDSTSDDVKNAAAYGLGRASVGATASFLPGILSVLEASDQRKQYLLLSALRELIHCYQTGSIDEVPSNVLDILPHLKVHCAHKEDAVRTMVAECMGSLACLKPNDVLPQIQNLITDQEKKDALVCSTVANSIKFTIAGHCEPSKLLPYMPNFLQLLKEEDLNARGAALLMVYSCVHHSPKLIPGFMEEYIMPSLVELIQLKLKRVVDMGPFKQTFDDALPLRKTTISIFATCLEKCPGTVDLQTFLPLLVHALGDVEDIQLQAHQILISMCTRYPREIVASIDSFVAPLEKTLNKRMGNKKGTELERAQEWIKSALRAMLLLSQVENAMSHQSFVEFVNRTEKASQFEAMLKEVEESL